MSNVLNRCQVVRRNRRELQSPVGSQSLYRFCRFVSMPTVRPHIYISFGSISRAASHEAHAATEARGTTCAAHAYALSKRKIIASINRQRYAEATPKAAGAVGLAASWVPRLAKTWRTPNTAGLVRGDATRSSQLARLASDRFRRPAVSVVSRCHASRGFG